MHIKGKTYTDGGVLNNMPAQPFESDFRHTIGVDVLNYLHLKKLPVDGIRETMLTAMRAAQLQNSEEGRDICFYLIEPKIIPAYHEFSFENYFEIYQLGYEAGKEYIAKKKGMTKMVNG
jgi:NTE family protein